ncbi:antibiotic resistance protein, partial [Sinorhizobium medicae]
CAAFGMVGIGEIYRQYATGELEDDSDVALLHAPEELGYAPLTLPLVNIRSTLRRLLEAQSLSVEDCARIAEAAASIFYKERTFAAIAARATIMANADLAIGRLRTGYMDQKRADGLELLKVLAGQPDVRQLTARDWEFRSTSLWERAFGYASPTNTPA